MIARNRYRAHARYAIFVACFALIGMWGAPGVAAQGVPEPATHIETDGSLGEVEIIELENGAYTIDESLGSFVAGQEGNLFHSFLEFGLADGDRAIFTATRPVGNVIKALKGR